MARPRASYAPTRQHHPLAPEDTTCCVCQEERRYLKMIPCKHNICEFCLENIILAQNQDLFPCPLCRAKTRVPQGGASGFPIYGSGIMDIEVNAALLQDAPMVCCSCDLELQTVRAYFCLQCKGFVCDDDLCHDKHPELSHNLILRSRGLEASGSVMKSLEEWCCTHDKKLELFCQTCWQPLCQICLQLKHKRHKMLDLRQAAESAQRGLEKARGQILPPLRLLEWVHEDVSKLGKGVQQEKRSIEENIRARAQEARNLINELEASALGSLSSLTNETAHYYSVDLNDARSKLSGMQAKYDHLNSTLSNGNKLKMLKMQPSAEDISKNSKMLGKFTSQLPETIFHIRNQNDKNGGHLKEVLEKFIGRPQLEKSMRKIPAVTVVHKIQLQDTRPEDRFCICSGGKDGLLVMMSSSPLLPSLYVLRQITVAKAFSMQTTTKFKSELRASLVNFDKESAVFSHGWPATFQRLLPGRLENIQLSTRKTTIFAKGRLRACLKEADGSSEILPLVSVTRDANIDFGAGQFSIRESIHPVSMDMDSLGQKFAVIDCYNHLRMYRRGATNPYSAYLSPSGSQVKIRDICFFRFGSHEVLLVADEMQEDVTVLDVNHGCRVIGPLMHNSGQLAHPVALNVDPYTGNLLVVCSTGRVVVCGITGVPVERGLQYVLGKLW